MVCGKIKQLQTEVCIGIYIVSKEESGMIVEFCRWGNSLAVPIPKALAEALKVSDGKRAEINVENGTLVLRPIVKPGRSHATRSMNCCAE
jgi:antitoxin component of MazEF toxin-antitoxin module